MPQDHHRIDYVEFFATDIEATKTFYSAAFGWTFTDWGPEYVSFENSGLAGGFVKADSNAAGGPLVILYSTALEETQKTVESLGAPVVKPIFSFPGGRRFHFLDPNGNELAVWSDK